MEQFTTIEQAFLTQAKERALAVTMFLMNGFQLRGTITRFDGCAVVLETDGKQQLIYKHAISTMVPQSAVTLP